MRLGGFRWLENMLKTLPYWKKANWTFWSNESGTRTKDAKPKWMWNFKKLKVKNELVLLSLIHTYKIVMTIMCRCLYSMNCFSHIIRCDSCSQNSLLKAVFKCCHADSYHHLWHSFHVSNALSGSLFPLFKTLHSTTCGLVLGMVISCPWMSALMICGPSKWLSNFGNSR
jgi:hypothetical protein